MYGFALFLDPHSTRRLAGLQRQLRRDGFPPTELETEPHVTIALATGMAPIVAKDAIDQQLPLAELRLPLGPASTFPDGSLYLRVAIDDRLRQLRQNVLDAIASADGFLDIYSRDDAWTPHVSMTGPLAEDQSPRAIERLTNLGWPDAVRATRLHLNEIPSLHPIAEWPLDGPR